MKSNVSIKVGHFDGKGTKIRGDIDVNVQVHPVSGTQIFFFEVTPIQDYTFLRYPVNPGGVVEDLGVLNNEKLATYFRYVGNSTVSTGGQPNVIVPFIVYGYLTSALTGIGSPVGP